MPSEETLIFNRCIQEAQRVCLSSPRIQNSGDIAYWENQLIQIRWNKILKLKAFPISQQLKLLNSRLKDKAPSYQFSPDSFADFLQNFHVEALRAFRREFELDSYSPKSRLQTAEFFVFCDRYASRKILGGIPLIRRRALDFLHSRSREISCEIEAAAEWPDELSAWGGMIYKAYVRAAQEKEREKLAAGDRAELISELIKYLEARKQTDCITYLKLVLDDVPFSEIYETLGLSRRQRDHLQQKLRYYVTQFKQRTDIG
ncbi:hypothetical protein NG799_02335 [Laspinema sp. D1]|uniref:Sigma-70 family RNA polymerase sigma factor n=2 Tax=Laspinema TaxID=2584823 RepID=A0ABT2MK97_9CYAN|nr:hypothetical protein [Laspinema sp. D2a]